MPLLYARLCSVWFAVCCAASVIACGTVGPPDGEERYLANIGLVNDAGRDTTWRDLYVVLDRVGGGEISEAGLRIAGLLDAGCVVSAYRHVEAGEEGAGSLEREYVTCGWNAGSLDLSVARTVEGSGRCWVDGGNEIPCPAENVLAFEPGALQFRDANDRQWHNATPFWDSSGWMD